MGLQSRAEEPSICEIKDTHFRIYAKPNAPGRMFNLAYGFYVVGTAHHDVNERRPGEYFGESEQAEYEVGLTAADVWGHSEGLARTQLPQQGDAARDGGLASLVEQREIHGNQGAGQSLGSSP